MSLIWQLRAALDAVDPVPAGVRDAAVMAGGLLGCAWELVELVEVRAPLVRGEVRVWEGEGLTVHRRGLEMVGWVPGGVSRVDVQTAGGHPGFAVVDGAFGGSVGAGPVRLLLRGARTGVTPWI
ncbi:hypothetical protein ACOBQX_15130 [Actinokineospora sp. G85]|uniref:hypothetical protein n=1 Tax=Actinokineospora sp. G85 TaxID=3406626 RepID=UPI003C707331